LIYVDSNYWIYWLDSRLPEHRYVDRVIREAIREGTVINYVTLIEVAHYLRKLPRDEFDIIMEGIQGLSALTAAELDEETTRLSLELLPKYSPKGLGARDCVVVATMKLLGVERIATHDHAFRGVKEIQVVDTIPAR